MLIEPLRRAVAKIESELRRDQDYAPVEYAAGLDPVGLIRNLKAAMDKLKAAEREELEKAKARP